jgi:hypothetical protein
MPSAQYFREQAEALRRHARASRRRRRLPPNWIIVRLSMSKQCIPGRALDCSSEGTGRGRDPGVAVNHEIKPHFCA